MLRTTSRLMAVAYSLLLLFLSVPPYVRGASQDKVADVVEMASKAIVNIKTEEWSKGAEEIKKTNVFKRFMTDEDDEGEVVENIGSGVVLDPKGIIVTNEHLIAKAINIRVKFMNGKEYEAYVLGSDPEFDIALLKVTDKTDLPYLKITKPKSVRVGEKVVVIGNPYGLSSSVSVGVISALGRNLRIDDRIYANLIQTDAAINPGNSGGALLDTDGNALGIVTAIYGEGKGIGFAIPIDDVLNMLSEFLRGDVKRPILGLFMEKRRDERGAYLYVSKVIPGSPAEKYGIEAGDRIVELNKRKIREGAKIQSILRTIRQKNSVQFKLARGTKILMVNVDTRDVEGYVPSPMDEGLCGVRISDIKGYPKLKFKLKEKDGVVVTKVLPGPGNYPCGVRPGDVIFKINNNTVLNKKDFDAFMAEGLKRNYILYQVKRREEIFFLPVKLDTLL
ncbi:MAG: Periplasmic pH-dependent serine endoprotease DegQ precursor [Syntrophorhabdus sp. PtaU1.Bin153]|nr:MAG: Periplasmic pH-dependent serine endoprotease DegQ precursor [Syntrophorhabdus sp. PtaU1.Bin153]